MVQPDRTLLDQLIAAYIACRRRKRGTEQEQVFTMELSAHLLELWKALGSGSYQCGPLRAFLVDRPVLREIFAPRFEDRTVHTLMTMELEPMIDRELIRDSYSCRKGKGTLYGIQRLKKFIAKCSQSYSRDCYVLQLDIEGFFTSIDRQRMLEVVSSFIERNYRGGNKEFLLGLVKEVVMHSPLDGVEIKGRREKWKELPDRKSLFVGTGAPKPCDYAGAYCMEMDRQQRGLPIGELPVQWLANLLLSRIDHWAKRAERIRFYGRYVDDIFVVHTDKDYLRELIAKFAQKLEALGLRLHPKKIRLQHYKKGVAFLGAYIKGGAILPGRRLRGGFSSLLDEIERARLQSRDESRILEYETRLNSYLGILSRLDSGKFIRKMLDQHPRVRRRYVFKEKPSVGMKAVSFVRIEHKKWEKARREANRAYHAQFTRGRKGKVFVSRMRLMRDAYQRRYVHPPVVHRLAV